VGKGCGWGPPRCHCPIRRSVWHRSEPKRRGCHDSLDAQYSLIVGQAQLRAEKAPGSLKRSLQRGINSMGPVGDFSCPIPRLRNGDDFGPLSRHRRRGRSWRSRRGDRSGLSAEERINAISPYFLDPLRPHSPWRSGVTRPRRLFPPSSPPPPPAHHQHTTRNIRHCGHHMTPFDPSVTSTRPQSTRAHDSLRNRTPAATSPAPVGRGQRRDVDAGHAVAGGPARGAVRVQGERAPIVKPRIGCRWPDDFSHPRVLLELASILVGDMFCRRVVISSVLRSRAHVASG